MIDTLQAFIRSINERKHVLLLIQNSVMTIELVTKDEAFSLLIKNGEVFITEMDSESSNKYRICGEKDRIKDLISGREKLRTLMKKRELQFTAPFRTTLMLESFFYLGRTDLFMAKIS